MGGIINTQSLDDSRKVVTGTDACLLNNEGKIMGTVETYQAVFQPKVASYQPLGDPQEHDIPVGYKVTLKFTEIMVRDEQMINDLFDYMNEGKKIDWNFQGTIKAPGGGEQRYIYNYCVPSGDIDLQNVAVGDVIKRNWNLTVNGPVKPQGLLSQ